MVPRASLHKAGNLAPSADSSLAPPPGMYRPAVRDARDRDVFDIYTIIFLALAVFIFLRLRSVLGQRTGRERPPIDPFSARDAVRNAPSDKVVVLPPRGGDTVAKPAEPSEAADRWKDISPPGSPAAEGLQAIAAQ